MTSISALENVYEKGLFGDYEDKNENTLANVSIIVKYKKQKSNKFRKYSISEKASWTS